MKELKQFEYVAQKTGLQHNECSCSICVQMCRHTPCMGTPEDIVKLIEAGFESRLQKTIWVAGREYGIPPIEMLQPLHDEKRGCCSFLNEQGLCELHDKGLKPTEGRLATCNRRAVVTPETHPAFVIAEMWIDILPENSWIKKRIL